MECIVDFVVFRDILEDHCVSVGRVGMNDDRPNVFIVLDDALMFCHSLYVFIGNELLTVPSPKSVDLSHPLGTYFVARFS